MKNQSFFFGYAVPVFRKVEFRGKSGEMPIFVCVIKEKPVSFQGQSRGRKPKEPHGLYANKG